MSFLEKKYIVTGHRGEIYSLTAEQLHERILKDSKSDYNWIAPANVLVAICKKASFPAEYELDIKCATLNCFANIEHSANCGGDRYIDPLYIKEAVWECYNTLFGSEDEKAISARKRYLAEMIARYCYTRTIFDPLYHPGPTFRKIREDWINSKCEIYISQKNVDFEKIEKELHDEFVELIKKAETEGAFEEDEKADRESWKMFYKRMKDII